MEEDTIGPGTTSRASNRDVMTDIRSQPTLTTGTAALDQVLGGGLPRDSLHILTGLPGAGKTIMAQQLSFAAAGIGLRVVYFTNVSESHAKLIAHVRNFDFYVPDLIGDRILIYNITSQVRNKGFKETLDFIVDTVRAEKVDLIVIDSFRGLKHVVDFTPQSRGAVFDLAARLAMLRCTTVLIGEYTHEEVQTEPEFAVADGIIRLSHVTTGVQDRRSLRVIKLRGSSYLGGEHSFEINDRGIDVYLRQESLTTLPRTDVVNKRISTGIDELDTMLSGGLLRTSSTLLAGAIGTGKTMLSLHFLAAGVAADEPGLMVTFQESPAQLAARVEPFGLAKQIQMLTLSHALFLSPVELNLDYAAARIRDMVETHHIRRVVLDSVAELEHAADDPQRFDNFLASLIAYLRNQGVTLLMTREISQVFGADLTVGSRGLPYTVDNIVVLRYFELAGKIQKAITILKSRGSDHEKTMREFAIEQHRVTIGQQLDYLSGVLTGMPQAIGATTMTEQHQVSGERSG